jgi:hypothetical protein
MSEHYLVKKKGVYGDKYTLADQPINLTATGKLSSDMVAKIADSGNTGYFIAFDEMIDGFDSVHDALKRELNFNYSPPGETPDDALKFLLMEADITDIHTPVEKAGLQIGGTLAMPALSGLTFPVDEGHVHWDNKPGVWRKVYDLKGKRNFVLGQPHAFSHTLKHNNITKSHPLIKMDSLANHKLLFPNATDVLPTGPPLLYAYDVHNDTIYDDEQPTVSEVTKATDAGSFENVTFVYLPDSSFPRQWHRKHSKYDVEGGARVPIEEHTLSTYKFLDNLYHNRCTTFDKSGMVWNARMVDKKSPVLFKLDFVVHPIVPNHENMELIPYLNFKKHASNSFPKI